MHLSSLGLTIRTGNWQPGHAGPYQTAGCGANIGGNLARVINQLIQDLPPIIQDAKNSQIKPSAAYSVFFKKSRNAPFISQLLTNVTTGAIMRPPVVPFTKGGPTFLCPRPGQTFEMQLPYGVIDAAEYCAGRDTPVAGCLQGTPYIMLCSKFFSGVAGPQTPPVGVCPRVNHAINKFRRSPTDDNNVGDTIIHNQMWILLEEIVHYYLFNQPNLKETIPEVYDINKAWHLSAKKSKRNAASYGYYAGSKSSPCCNHIPG